MVRDFEYLDVRGLSVKKYKSRMDKRKGMILWTHQDIWSSNYKFKLLEK